MSDDDAITPAERRVTDSTPAKEELSVPLTAHPRIVRFLWPDVLCLLGALFAPPLTMTGYLVLSRCMSGSRGSIAIDCLVVAAGVLLGAASLLPLLRAPGRARLGLLCVYVVLISVVLSIIYFFFVQLARMW